MNGQDRHGGIETPVIEWQIVGAGLNRLGCRILFGQAPVEFLGEVFIRTLIIFILLLVALRLMGKRMAGKSGLEFLEEIKNAGVKAPVILISGQANIEIAVRATKLSSC